MDIKRLNEIVAESMNKVLNEALSIQCQGDIDWKNATKDIKAFIKEVEKFDSQFMALRTAMARDRRGEDYSSSIKELCNTIRIANGKIFKQKGENNFEQRSSLKGKYAIPINAMYEAKSGMVTVLLQKIKSNRAQFSKIESVLECDDEGKRAINVYYEREKIGSYHMPEAVEALRGLYTKINRHNWQDRDEDLVRSDGSFSDIEARKKALKRNQSQITEDYLTPLETLKQWVGTEIANANNRQQEADIKKRKEEADRGIAKGYIIPIFNNDKTKPCFIKNAQGNFNAIPNALANTKNDYMLRDKRTNESIWFATTEEDKSALDTINFLNPVDTNGIDYVGYVKISGEHGIMSSLDEMLKNIAKQIVNEIKKWGIKKVML